MSLEVFFNNAQIEADYIVGLSTNAEMFNKSFKLGQTILSSYKLIVAKEAINVQPTQVTLRDNGSVFAILDIDDIKEDDYTYTYTLTDRMVNLEFNYDASEIFINGSTTLLNIVLDICNKVGITLYTQDFRGYNKSISWYDNTRTAREYIGYIAELNGGYARIDNGQLKFIKQEQNSVKTISIDDCADFVIGEYHKITRVVYEIGTLKYEYGNEDNNTLYLNGENVFITTEAEVEGIYNDIKNFEFYSFTTTNCPIDFNVKAGEIITFTDGTNNYPTIANYSLDYFGDWYGGYSLDINTERQEETKLIGDKQKIKNLSIKVDRAENSVSQVIEEVDSQNQKISSVEQTVAELNSKISDIADITTSGETTFATLDLDNVNQSEPIYIKIYPISNNISYLYPRNNLYPNNDLYSTNRKIRFINKTTDEFVDYELPDDLLWYDGENYDEFILGYDEQICQVNKKCKYNADGTVSLLETPITVDYPYPLISLMDGDYTISLLGYGTAYLQVKLMAQNIYTTQFATKAEVSSELSQTASSITAEVNQTLQNYSTTTQMNSAINIKANEITSSVSSTYETKTGVNTKINGAKSEIKQTTDAITSTVSTKVGNDEVISKINQSAEAVGINANKIELSANDILNLLAGNTINLTSKNIVISSNNFNVDKNGNILLKGKYTDDSSLSSLVIDNNTYTKLKEYCNRIKMSNSIANISADIGVGDASSGVMATIGVHGTSGTEFAELSIEDSTGTAILTIAGGGNYSYVKPGYMQSHEFRNTSLESLKKNFNKFNEALSIIKESEIYEYNFKSEKNDEKKHIGFVIPDKGGDYKTPEQVISKDCKAIEIYSMASIMWKAIQELTEKVEKLEEEKKNAKN